MTEPLGSPAIASALSETTRERPDVWRNLRVATGHIAAALHEHRVPIALVVTYVLFAAVILVPAGLQYPLRLTYPHFTRFWILAGVFFLFLHWGKHPSLLRIAAAPERVLGALIVGLLFVPFHATFVSLKLAIGAMRGFPYDPALARVDEWIHGGPAWRFFEPLLSHRFLLDVVLAYYAAFWTCVFLLFLVWLAWSSHRRIRIRGLITLILVWSVGGSVCAWFFASAGPCFFPVPQYQALIARFDLMHFELADLQRWHMRNQIAQTWAPYAGVSAFPSMHVAVATTVAIVSYARSRAVGIAMWAFALSIQLLSVMLGWHYAIDGYAAALIATGSWRVSSLLADASGNREDER